MIGRWPIQTWSCWPPLRLANSGPWMQLIKGRYSGQKNKHCRPLEIMTISKRCNNYNITPLHIFIPLVVIMVETNQIKVALKWLVCIRHPTVDTLTLRLGVNSTESIMKMNNPVIEDIKKRLGVLLDPNLTTDYRVECGLQTMHSI